MPSPCLFPYTDHGGSLESLEAVTHSEVRPGLGDSPSPGPRTRERQAGRLAGGGEGGYFNDNVVLTPGHTQNSLSLFWSSFTSF